MANSRADSSRPPKLPPIVVQTFALIVFLSFWFPDVFYYPFRAFSSGPQGVYGTWTGIVRTTPSPRRGIAMDTDGQDGAATTSNPPTAGPSFAVVKMMIRPPFFSTMPRFFWRPSPELAGAVDVYLPDGTHEHCIHQLGGFPDSGQLQLLIYDRWKKMNATAEAQVTPAGLQFSSGMCPVLQGPSVTFAGTLTRNSTASVATLRAQLPATITADRIQVAAADVNFAREWVGPISAYDPDPLPSGEPTNTVPNAIMRLRFTPQPNTPGAFTGEGEFRGPDGIAETFTLPAATLHGQAFEATAKFRDTTDALSVNNGSGDLSGTVAGDALTITEGGKMLLRITGTLHPGTDADFTHALATLTASRRAAHN